MPENLVELSARGGARASLSLHGGQLLGWTPAGGAECLYLAPSARQLADSTAALRGGVPVVFPQFAAQGPLPRHGLVRTRPWQLVQQDSRGTDAMAVLRCESDLQTLAQWPHAFALELTVRIEGASLEMELAVENLGERAFSFQAALHSYWRIEGMATIEGLRDRPYREAGQEGAQHSHTLELMPGRPIDRIVGAPAAPLRLNDLQAESQRCLVLEPSGFDDAVVWNPGPGHGLADLPADAWRQFVCLELGQILRPARVEPGETWCGLQRVTQLQG